MYRFRSDSSSDTPVTGDVTVYHRHHRDFNDSGVLVYDFESYDPQNYGHYVNQVPFSRNREMTDVIGSRRADHSCGQYSRITQLFTGVQSNYSERYNSGAHIRETYLYEVNIGYNSSSWLSDPGTIQSIDPVEDTSMGEMMLRHAIRCKNACQTRVDLGNFLRELPELRKLADTVIDGIRAFRRNPNFDKIITNPNLAWKFGVEPFISDLKGLVNAFSGMASEAKRLRQLSGQSQRIKTTGSSDIEGYGDQFHVRPSVAPHTGTPGTVGEDIFKPFAETWAVSYVSFDVRDISEFGLWCYAACRAFGFDNPAKIAWNSIPASFVFDWIFPVSRLLELANLGSWFIPTYVSRTTTHCKIERTRMQFTSSFTANDSTILVVDDFMRKRDDEKLYRRWVGLPPGGNLFDSLGIGQLWLATLLGKQWFLPSKRPSFPVLPVKGRLRR